MGRQRTLCRGRAAQASSCSQVLVPRVRPAQPRLCASDVCRLARQVRYLEQRRCVRQTVCELWTCELWTCELWACPGRVRGVRARSVGKREGGRGGFKGVARTLSVPGSAWRSGRLVRRSLWCMKPPLQRFVSHRLGLLLGRRPEIRERGFLAPGVLATAGHSGIRNVRFPPLAVPPFLALTGGRLVGVRVSVHAAHAAGGGGCVGGCRCAHRDGQEHEQTAAHRPVGADDDRNEISETAPNKTRNEIAVSRCVATRAFPSKLGAFSSGRDRNPPN